MAAEAVIAVAAVTPRPVRGPRALRARRFQLIRYAILVVIGAFLLLPQLSLLEFSTRGIGLTAPRTLEAWRRIADPAIIDAILASLELAVLTSVLALALMVPTMVWVRLRVPRMTRVVEFLCLLPLTIPAIVLVVGLFPVYAWVRYLLRTDSILTLFLAYSVIVLPYVYRSLDTGLRAMDVRTLSEAARSLGAGWATVILRIVVPNMAGAVLNAALLCVAIVMGEYTIVSLFNYVSLPVAVQQLGLSDAGLSVALSLASLIFVFVLLLLLSLVGRRRARLGRTS
ncbi:MAG: ABC transporter permease subunit [Kineosporiaceae bacterium]